MLSSHIYDILKYIAQIVLPGLASLYAALAGIWSLPYAEAIPATIMAIDFFLGVLLKLDSNKYYKGVNQ